MKLALVSRDTVFDQAEATPVNHRSQLKLSDDSIAAICKLSAQGFLVIMVSHQPGISRGLLDLEELEAIHNTIISAVETAGGELAAIFYCPHDKEDRCHCRPPETGLLDVIEMEFDCNTTDSVYFFMNEEEAAMISTKGCKGIRCDRNETPLLTNVTEFLT
jgi:D-glycero-D-manno-heptose 1,7-bisphosphate phosphatase